MVKKVKDQLSLVRPPVVAVLGHVDHGKTTLLDTIRKSNVAAHEHGGITQHIGAYQVQIKSGQLITFIDTPGHEAFAKMRSRGAQVADIAILVVAADDSVKPQTKESIEQIKAAGIPMIVAVNKVDLPTANVDRVKQDLAKVGVQVEGFGGDVPIQQVSAKAGTGVDSLLDLIVLVAQMREFTSEPEAPFSGIVIETRLDKGKGMVATIVVKKGTLKFGMPLFEGDKQIARVRACFDEYGKGVTQAPPSKPVEVLGFTSLPSVGEAVTGEAIKPVVVQPKISAPQPAALPDFLKPQEDILQTLKVVLKTDTAGSMEAIRQAFSTRIDVVSSGVGEITESDILDARACGAFVIGFNVKIATAAEKLAETEKVVFRVYTIIYELLDELTEVVAGLKEVIAKERELGVGEVIAEFPFEKDRIAGTRVLTGRLAKGDTVKVMHGESEIGRARIRSVRQGKNEITKVTEKGECGILLDKKVDFSLGDAIIAVTI
jgi:translation initiation factor IF-2